MAYGTPTITDSNTVSEILLDMIRVALGTLSTNTTGLATAAKQDTGNTSLASILAKIIAAPATEAKQDTSNTWLSNIHTDLTYINAKFYASKGAEIWGSVESIVDTTLTTILPAQGAGNYTYASSILVTNAHATVGTIVRIIDGNDDTTVLYSGYAAPAGGGFSVSLPTPIRSGLDNKALKAKCVTTGASITVSLTGWKGA